MDIDEINAALRAARAALAQTGAPPGMRADHAACLAALDSAIGEAERLGRDRRNSAMLQS
ncbi:hypothetical protein [Sphingomonas flavalba]|uniref:hypothetical protein n=1 Tax=Sphingomonas flavalba TaxID=2559804 RepID=UPI00109DE8B5|nr:hypothetical protein [Sphingomonas flavalba]